MIEPRRNTDCFMGNYTLSDTVAQYAASVQQSRCGPVFSSAVDVPHPPHPGKYHLIAEPLLPDRSSASSPHLPVLTTPMIISTAIRPASQFILYYQNVGGINCSIADYQLACSDACYDMYAFTETWLNDNTLSSQLFDESYSVFRQDRSPSNSSKRSGGGVLLAVRSCFKPRLLITPENATVEHLWVAIPSSNATLFVCVVYFPPDRVNDNTLIDKHLSSVNCIISQIGPKDNLVVLGDFNLSGISWLNDSYGFYYPDPLNSSFGSASSCLIDTYLTAGLRQLNGIVNANSRTLDLCFLSEEFGPDCTLSQALTPLVKSCRHHPALQLTMNLNPIDSYNAVKETFFYDFRRGNYSGMNDFLFEIDWNVVLHDCDANRAASTVSNILLYAIEQFIPKRNNNKPSKPAWANSHLKRLKRKKRAALRVFSKYRTFSMKMNYLHINRQYKSMNTRLYRSYQCKLQHRLKSNPKYFWRHVRDQRKESGLPAIMTNGTIEVDSTANIAELFRTQFSSVFTNEQLSLEELEAATRNVPRMPTTNNEVYVTSAMVISAGNRLKSSTGYGPDGIPSLVLKQCLDSLAIPLTTIFNLSLRSGMFPSCWKESFVFPVFKKGCKRLVSNYRGIASLSATSKLFELIVLDYLTHACAQHVSADQHGYLPKRSTTTNLTCFVSYAIREIERGHQVDAIYTDLSAAFDKMNHQIAVAKYDLLGIHNSIVTWLRSYLTGRSMSVKIGDCTSSAFPVTSGVPQGSHLGPFLFLLFMNDATSTLTSRYLFYADDLKLYAVVKDSQDLILLQQALETFANWCQTNRMLLNVSKCSVVSFARKRSILIHDYKLNGTNLDRKQTIKDLGVLLDSELTFKCHISYIVSKASSRLGFIFRFAKNFKDIYCLKALFCGLVRPLLESSSVVWCPYYQNEVSRIEAVQRKFIRFALRNLPWEEPAQLPSYESRCKLINLELLSSRRDVSKACFISDLLQSHIDCSKILALLEINTRPRNLRSNTFFYNRLSRTNYGLNEPVTSMCRTFNNCYEVFDFNSSRDTNKRNFRVFFC